MPIGTLTGYAVPLAAFPWLDHTYVTSSLGHTWGCRGRSTGGRQICTGSGNIDQANCLAQPNGRAGVDYGFTGVCHQMANRILFPAQVVVSSANGYRASEIAYGAYGFDPATGQNYSPAGFPWPELQDCQTNHAHP